MCHEQDEGIHTALYGLIDSNAECKQNIVELDEDYVKEKRCDSEEAQQ